MFTGLVREVGRLQSTRTVCGLTELDIAAPRSAGALSIGDSLAVNGICLTVTAMAGNRVRVDVSAETRRVTTVREWHAGEQVHLEPALRAGDPLGGHFVLGHVDGIGRVARVARAAGALSVTVTAPGALLAQLLPKGSVAMDGVSLTLDRGPFDRTFTVTLVPHTLRETRFDRIRPGDHVNLEVDVLSKAVRQASQAGLKACPTGILTVDAILTRGWRSVSRGA